MRKKLLDRRYLIIETLGQGGFGHTFLAKDTKLPGNPICVVKQLKPDNSEPVLLKKAQILFSQEADILQLLGEHPQIPRLFAYFQERGEFYLVQEYIHGYTLAHEIIPGKLLPEEQVIATILELLKILEFVHFNSVIHRDIKPANTIRRQTDNKLVLIDFGAVKRVTNQQQQKTMIIGTPAYVPIEQFQGEPNFRSDIYSLGMMGIQALTGIRFKPYVGGGLNRDEQGELIWRNYAQVSDRLATILTKMTRYDYRDRYQSATEAIAELQKLINTPSTTTILNNFPKNIKISKNQLLFFTIPVFIAFSILLSLKIWQDNIFSSKELTNGKTVKNVIDNRDACNILLENIHCEQYTFKGRKGQQVILKMVSKNFDPYLVLRTPDGNKLELSEDMSPGNWNAQIVTTLPINGNYTVIAGTSSKGESGSYSLDFSVE